MKKIIAMGFFSILLLTSLTAVSTAQIKPAIAIKNSGDDLPDLIVEVLVYYYDPSLGNAVVTEVGINNTGAPIEEPINVTVKLTLDSNEETIEIEYNGTGLKGKQALINFDPGTTPHILTAIVDPPYEGHPNGDIEESNEANNVKSITVKSVQVSIPQSTSAITKTSFNSQILQSLVSKIINLIK